MDKSNIFIIVLVVTVLAVRLYMKYVKKDGDKKKDHSINSAGTSSSDDDYEPYAKK